jgi:hypothetical protein
MKNFSLLVQLETRLKNPSTQTNTQIFYAKFLVQNMTHRFGSIGFYKAKTRAIHISVTYRQQVQVVPVASSSHDTDVRFSIFSRYNIQRHALVAATPAPMTIAIDVNTVPKYVVNRT